MRKCSAVTVVVLRVVDMRKIERYPPSITNRTEIHRFRVRVQKVYQHVDEDVTVIQQDSLQEAKTEIK